jgi:uncharacterized membrane protein
LTGYRTFASGRCRRTCIPIVAERGYDAGVSQRAAAPGDAGLAGGADTERQMGRTGLIIVGAALVIVGLVSLFWQRITYTQRETLVNVAGVKVTADTEKSFPLSPIIGGVALAGGVALLIVGARKP